MHFATKSRLIIEAHIFSRCSLSKVRNYSRISRRWDRFLSPNLWISNRSSSELETVACMVTRVTIKGLKRGEKRPHNEAWNGGALMARSRRIPGRLEAEVSLKAFEREREKGGGEGKGEERVWGLVTKPPEDSFVENSSARRQRTLRRIALLLDIVGIGFCRFGLKGSAGRCVWNILKVSPSFCGGKIGRWF